MGLSEIKPKKHWLIHENGCYKRRRQRAAVFLMGKRRRALWNMVNQKKDECYRKRKEKSYESCWIVRLDCGAGSCAQSKRTDRSCRIPAPNPAQESGRRMAERAVHHPLLESFGGLGKWESASGRSCGGRWAFDAEKQRGDCSTGNCAGKACQKGMKYFNWRCNSMKRNAPSFNPAMRYCWQ